MLNSERNFGAFKVTDGIKFQVNMNFGAPVENEALNNV